MPAISEHLSINIDRRQVLQTIGYRADSTVPARILSLVNEFAENSRNFIDPSYSYIVRDIQSVQGDRVTIEDSVTFESEVIARLLEQCEKVLSIVQFALSRNGYGEAL